MAGYTRVLLFVLATLWVITITNGEVGPVGHGRPPKASGEGPLPDGHGPLPNGHGPLPDGHGALPNGHGALPNGHGARPNGHGALPNGHGALPNGHGALPNGQGALPNGQGALPNGHGALPNGQGALPNGHGALPNGHGALPNGHGALPNGQGALPNGHGALPNGHGALLNAHGAPQPPRPPKVGGTGPKRISSITISAPPGKAFVYSTIGDYNRVPHGEASASEDIWADYIQDNYGARALIGLGQVIRGMPQVSSFSFWGVGLTGVQARIFEWNTVLRTPAAVASVEVAGVQTQIDTISDAEGHQMIKTTASFATPVQLDPTKYYLLAFNMGHPDWIALRVVDKLSGAFILDGSGWGEDYASNTNRYHTALLFEVTTD